MMNSRKAYLALGMATLAFIVSFAAWSLLSSLAPQLQQQYRIDDFWISVIIAVPVILGSLARIPMGILTDRFGGRRMMTGLLLFSVIPMLGMTTAANMAGFLIWGFFLGVVGSSFAIGVPYVNRWFTPVNHHFCCLLVLANKTRCLLSLREGQGLVPQVFQCLVMYGTHGH
ncbi:MAG TPA: MFS transporter [Ktedonobacteraceae bacterium]|nr:MFS transporter [Ktedonobacteraceae bacterium]